MIPKSSKSKDLDLQEFQPRCFCKLPVLRSQSIVQRYYILLDWGAAHGDGDGDSDEDRQWPVDTRGPDPGRPEKPHGDHSEW